MARQFLTAIDLAKNELQNAVVQNLAGAPSSPAKGQLYMNTSDNTLYWWDGTAWVAAKDAGGTGFPGYAPGGSTVAETAFGQAKADGVATTVARADHTHGSPTHDAAAHSTIPLSALAVPTGPVSFNSQRITLLGTPSAAQDAVSKQYVDNLIQGLSWKDSVKAASTTNVTLSGTQTIDGVALSAQDRVLLKNQTAPAENGIWAVAAGSWSRVTDADSEADLINATVFVEQGTTQADTAWTMTTNGPITIGTTALTWVQFGAGATYAAGAGLTLTANTFDVVAGDSSITVAADSVIVATDGVTNAKLANMAANTLKGNNTGATTDPVDLTVAQVKTMLGGWGSFAAAGSSAGTSTLVTNPFNSRDVIVQVYRNSAPYDQVECDIEHTATNQITVRFATAVASGEYRIVLAGYSA